MKVTENQVIQAMKVMQEIWTSEPSTLVKSIASQLESDMDEGEFDGSLQSAVLCLEVAGYDVEMESAA